MINYKTIVLSNNKPINKMENKRCTNLSDELEVLLKTSEKFYYIKRLINRSKEKNIPLSISEIEDVINDNTFLEMEKHKEYINITKRLFNVK